MENKYVKKQNKIIYKDLSYKLNGLLFKVHNDLGRFCREKQYGDALEKLFKREGVIYEREKPLFMKEIENNFTNIVDFYVENKILLDIKAKQIITKEDYYQINRYLNAGKYRLGLIVNFRNKYLKPIRVIRANS